MIEGLKVLGTSVDEEVFFLEGEVFIRILYIFFLNLDVNLDKNSFLMVVVADLADVDEEFVRLRAEVLVIWSH